MTEEIVVAIAEKDSVAAVVYHVTAAPNYPEAFKEIYRGPPISRKKIIAFARILNIRRIVDVRKNANGMYKTHYDWSWRTK